MTPVPDFIVELRRLVGDHPLWMPGVTAVIRRGNEVLLVRRADNGRWTPVTGITDPGEEPAVTAAREAMEETGTRIRVDRLAATSVHPEVIYDNGDRASYLDLTFACTWLEGEAHVADDESSDVRWWPLSSLPEMSDLMLDRIEAATSDEREARFVAPAGQEEAAPPPVLTPDAPVLGVDACPAGWVGVVLDPSLRASVFVAADITGLLELVREHHDVPVVAVDIPIGLPDSGGRLADAEARRALTGKASSVFSTPVRSAVEAATYAEAREANLAATGGRTSVSAQAYALRDKVLQVDAWVRGRPGALVIEVHPEVSFARMAGAPVLARKKDADGVRARREALAAHGIVAPAYFRGAGFGEDDLLDACAAAWTAVR
ncbi:MAG TPA: DUF429 domain-containing protein, partial [Nocardioides sp.]|nr:DUF429 domain-containing protein [Nocardioides sp.]